MVRGFEMGEICIKKLNYGTIIKRAKAYDIYGEEEL